MTAQTDQARGLQIEGKHVVVTGGARGIGLAVVENVLAHGGSCTIVDVRDDAVEVATERLRDVGDVTGEVCDVRDFSALEAVFDRVVARHGRVDGCVASAGVQEAGPSEYLELDRWQRVIDVNLTGVFATAQLAGRVMLEQGSGSFVSLASAAAVRALAGRAPYCATKAAVASLTRVLAVEWASRGVRVNAVGPGWVATDLVRTAIRDGYLSEEGIVSRTPIGRLAEPAEIADVITFLLSPRSSYITGQTLYPDGGFTAAGA